MGGVVALKVAGRNREVDAIVGLGFSDRYIGRVGRTIHGDFNDFWMTMTRFHPSYQDERAIEGRRSYQAICRYLMHFLDGVLRGDAEGLAYLSRSSVEMTASRMASSRGATRPTPSPHTDACWTCCRSTARPRHRSRTGWGRTLGSSSAGANGARDLGGGR